MCGWRQQERLLSRRGIKQTLAEVRETPGSEDLDEHGAVLPLPALASLVQSPRIAVNQLITHCLCPAGLWATQAQGGQSDHKCRNESGTAAAAVAEGQNAKSTMRQTWGNIDLQNFQENSPEISTRVWPYVVLQVLLVFLERRMTTLASQKAAHEPLTNTSWTTADWLYGTFLVGFLDIQELSVVSGSQDLNQGVLICTYTLRNTEGPRGQSPMVHTHPLKLKDIYSPGYHNYVNH